MTATIAEVAAADYSAGYDDGYFNRPRRPEVNSLDYVRGRREGEQDRGRDLACSMHPES